MFGFLLLAALGQCANYNYTSVFEGRWNITMIELDEEGNENAEAQIYSVSLAAGEDLSIQGQVFGDDEDGVPTPIAKLGRVMDAEDNTTFSVQFAPSPDAESLEELTSVKLENGVDDVVLTTGKTTDGITYSVNVVSVNVIEVTLFNKETKAITILRCLKELPPQKQGSMWQAFLPMLPTLLFTLFGNKNRPMGPPGAQAGGEKQKTE